jgi:glycosyltransferase involved in cell wall biosynthesis
MSAPQSRRPRVLYLAFYFPPSRASGVYRARATANHLAGHGWDVTVLAAPLEFLHGVIGSVDEALLGTVDPRVRVERPELDLSPWEHNLREFGRFRGTFPVLARRMQDRRDRKDFPERYASWAWDGVRRALKLHAKDPFDVVVATGNPFASFAGAERFSRRTGVPYVIDYRDSWTLDLFTDGPAFPDGHPAYDWEKKVIGGAASVVFVNNALREWHAERYPAAAASMMVVPNGWDPDVLTAGGAETPADPTRPLQFGYLGTLTNNQPVEQMVEGFRRAREHPDLAGAELNIHGHLGFFQHAPALLRERLGLGPDGAPLTGAADAGVRYRGPVSKTDVASVYESNDVLVFLAAGGRYVTSGKIFEYMASGRPIVSVHAPDIAAREVLEGYPLWFNAGSLEPDALAQSIIAAGKAARDCTPEQRAAARRHADVYARATLLDPFEARLRSLVRRPLDPPAPS